jgi:two-component system, response regulator YesN
MVPAHGLLSSSQVPGLDMTSVSAGNGPVHTVLIVDDEPRVLSGIRRTFPWEEFGFEVACATTDPAEGLRILRQGSIDLALVDIRMPEITGLDMIHAAREQGLRTEFVIVSGHSEFEFAQDALRSGVLDYCLKPIRADRARAILERAAARLAGRHDQRPPVLPSDLVRNPRLVAGAFGPRVAWFRAVVCVSAVDGSRPPAPPRFPDGLTIFATAHRGEALHVLGGESGTRDIPLDAPPEGLMGIGRTVDRLEAVPESIEGARLALGSRFMYPERRVFTHADVRLGPSDGLVADIRTAIVEENPDLLEAVFRDLPARVRSHGMMVWDLAHLHNRLADAVNRLCPSDDETWRMVGTTPESLGRSHTTLESWRDSLRSTIVEHPSIEGFRALARAEGDERFRSMLAYVRDNLHRHLTMADLARRYHFHPNYGCALWKARTGATFTEYLTRLRMKKARHLLLESGATIQEIASAVGYDYFYFIKLFKGEEGSTPSQYRRERAAASAPEA